MKLGVFQTVTPNPWGGTYTVREDLFRGLASAIDESDHELAVFTPDVSAAKWYPSKRISWIEIGGLHARALLSFVKRRVNRTCSHGLLLPAPFAQESWIDTFLLREGVDLFVNLGPVALTMSVPYICTVFDLQHKMQPFMPEVNVRGYWERWDQQYREYLGRAAFVVSGTRAGADEIVGMYQVPRHRIIYAPLPTPGFAMAASGDPRPARPSYLGDAPFLFYPAQFWPHKNHVTLLEALAQLRQKSGFDLQLVLVGSDQGNQAFVTGRIAAMGLTGAVHMRGFVDRAELLALYRHALAMVCASTNGPESLPSLEALALGCPLITADMPGIREQFENVAMLVPITDPARIAEAVLTLAGDPARRDALVAAGRSLAAERTAERFARRLFNGIEPFAQVRKNWSAREPFVRPHRFGRIFGR